VNEGKTGLEAERDQALAALFSLRYKKKLGVEKRRETHGSSNEKKEKWIDDYVDRETAVARERVVVNETAIQQEQNDIWWAEILGLTARKPERTFEVMLNAIGDSPNDLAISINGEDVEVTDNDEDDSELYRMSDDDQPRWVMGTITKSVLHWMESFQQKQMRIDQLTQPGWGDAADYFRVSDMLHGKAELIIPAVVKLQTYTVVVAPAPKTIGQLM